VSASRPPRFKPGGKCLAAALVCLVLDSGAMAQGQGDRVPAGQPSPAASGSGMNADQSQPPTNPALAQSSAPATASPSCQLALAQTEAHDESLARLGQEAKSLPQDDPGRCDALKRLRMLVTTRVALSNATTSCGVNAKEAENAGLTKELDGLLASCPPISPASCALSAQIFAQATAELLQDSALGIYANMAAIADPRVCKYIRSMQGVLIEQRADAEVIGQSCQDLLGQGSDDERALLIAFIEARQKIERHETAIKPRIAGCRG
jgi:hypothetical protein